MMTHLRVYAIVSNAQYNNILKNMLCFRQIRCGAELILLEFHEPKRQTAYE
jgi:hypothetical protein